MADSPGVKFFLARFICLYGLIGEVTLNQKDLANAIGVTDRVAKSAISQLVRQGLLTHQVIGGRRGRPSSSYICSIPALVGLLGSTSESEHFSMYERCVDRLLEGAAKPEDARRIQMGNRLLLAVLMAHADEFGFVRGLGARDLSELTGIKKQAIRERMGTLMDLQLIRAIVPGVTAKKLFKPTSSQYILNLGHPMLQELKAPFVVVMRMGIGSARGGDDQAVKILEAASKASQSLGMGVVKVDLGRYAVASVFVEKELRRLGPMLQARIDSYASVMLSEHFKDAGEKIMDLKEHIKKDFAYLDVDARGSAEYDALVGLLYDQTESRVKWFKAGLEKLPYLAPHVRNMKCAILPPPSVPRRENVLNLSLLVLSEVSPCSPAPACFVADMTKGNRGIQGFEHEEEIALDDRYRFGLLTRPKLSMEA